MNTTSIQQTINNKRRKVDCTRVRDMFLLGFTIANIEAAFGITRKAVLGAFRRIGLSSGRLGHKREILSNGNICCSICGISKKAGGPCWHSSYCTSCGYAQKAMRSNHDLDQAIHMRNVCIRNRAKHEGIFYDLTDEQLVELYVTQGGRCAYCGKALGMKLGAGRNPSSASIERIIPQKCGGTYTLKNVLWVHFGCNARRWAHTGARLKVRFPEASKAIEQVAQARQLDLPFPTDSQINVTNDPEPQPAAA